MNRKEKKVDTPLRLSKSMEHGPTDEEHRNAQTGEGDPRYLIVDVHGFDGEKGMIVETKPALERGESPESEAPLRLEVVSGIIPAELHAFTCGSLNVLFDHWENFYKSWFSYMPLSEIPSVPPIREQMISKVDLLPGLPPYRSMGGSDHR